MNITIYTMEELVLLDGMLSCTLKICRYTKSTLLQVVNELYECYVSAIHQVTYESSITCTLKICRTKNPLFLGSLFI